MIFGVWMSQQTRCVVGLNLRTDFYHASLPLSLPHLVFVTLQHFVPFKQRRYDMKILVYCDVKPKAIQFDRFSLTGALIRPLSFSSGVM